MKKQDNGGCGLRANEIILKTIENVKKGFGVESRKRNLINKPQLVIASAIRIVLVIGKFIDEEPEMISTISMAFYIKHTQRPIDSNRPLLY